MKRKKVSRLFLSPTNLFIFLFIYYYYFWMKSLCGSSTRGIYIERDTRVVCIGDGVWWNTESKRGRQFRGQPNLDIGTYTVGFYCAVRFFFFFFPCSDTKAHNTIVFLFPRIYSLTLLNNNHTVQFVVFSLLIASSKSLRSCRTHVTPRWSAKPPPPTNQPNQKRLLHRLLQQQHFVRGSRE